MLFLNTYSIPVFVNRDIPTQMAYIFMVKKISHGCASLIHNLSSKQRPITPAAALKVLGTFENFSSQDKHLAKLEAHLQHPHLLLPAHRYAQIKLALPRFFA